MLIHSLQSHKSQSERKWKFLHFVSDSLWPQGLYSPWNSPGQNTGVGSHSLLQGIFPTQGSNSGLPHCRRILYQLNHQESPTSLKVLFLFFILFLRLANFRCTYFIFPDSFTSCLLSAWRLGRGETLGSSEVFPEHVHSSRHTSDLLDSA